MPFLLYLVPVLVTLVTLGKEWMEEKDSYPETCLLLNKWMQWLPFDHFIAECRQHFQCQTVL